MVHSSAASTCILLATLAVTATQIHALQSSGFGRGFASVQGIINPLHVHSRGARSLLSNVDDFADEFAIEVVNRLETTRRRYQPNLDSSLDITTEDKEHTTKLVEKESIIDDEEVRCVVRTTIQEVERQKNGTAHAKAVTKAFQKACTPGAVVTRNMFLNVFRNSEARAFTETAAKAMIHCKAKVTAPGFQRCVSVTASAEAYAIATARAHAQAVADAVTACGCMTQTVADSISDVTLYLKLVSQATSDATAKVCVSSEAGKQEVEAMAKDTCSSKVFGKVFAESTATAMSRGACTNSNVIANTLTDIGGDFISDSTCDLEPTVVKYDGSKEALMVEEKAAPAPQPRPPLTPPSSKRNSKIIRSQAAPGTVYPQPSSPPPPRNMHILRSESTAAVAGPGPATMASAEVAYKSPDAYAASEPQQPKVPPTPPPKPRVNSPPKPAPKPPTKPAAKPAPKPPPEPAPKPRVKPAPEPTPEPAMLPAPEPTIVPEEAPEEPGPTPSSLPPGAPSPAAPQTVPTSMSVDEFNAMVKNYKKW